MILSYILLFALTIAAAATMIDADEYKLPETLLEKSKHRAVLSLMALIVAVYIDHVDPIMGFNRDMNFLTFALFVFYGAATLASLLLFISALGNIKEYRPRKKWG